MFKKLLAIVAVLLICGASIFMVLHHKQETEDQSAQTNQKIEQQADEENITEEDLYDFWGELLSGSTDKDKVNPTKKYTVKYETNGGGLIKKQAVAEGTKISDLPTPYKAEYIFLGWYYDGALTKAVESNDKVTKNMTLYASYLEQSPLETLESVNFAAAEGVGEDFTITLTSTEPMSKREVKGAITAKNLSNNGDTDFINVDKQGDEFVISGVKRSPLGDETAGFKAGSTYQITLEDERLNFDGYDETAREFNFTVYKEEVMNMKLSPDIIFIPAADLSNITNEGKSVSNLNIALYEINSDGSMSTADMTKGTFVYTKGSLKEGQIVSIYEGLIPSERTLDTPADQLGAIAYVKITKKTGNTYNYESADAEDVIFTPDMLPLSDEFAGKSGLGNKIQITVEDKYFDYSADIYSEMKLDSQTTVDAGDFLVFYTGNLAEQNGKDAAKRTEVYGEILEVIKNDNGTTTVTYREVDWEYINSSMDIYTEDEMTADELLEGINTAEIEAEIEQQAIDSGFAEEAAQYLASLSLATENFNKLSDNMNLEDYKVVLEDGSAVTPEELQLMDNGVKVEVSDTKVKASVSKRPTHLGDVGGTDADQQGLALSLEVTSVMTIGSDDSDGVLEITITGKFVEEVGFDYGASSEIVWDVAGIIPYISEYIVSANIDTINYTGLEISAVMVTKEAGEDGDATDVAAQIKELLKQNTNPETGDDHHTKLVQKYSEMVTAESDWIKLVEINIFSFNKGLPPALPIIALDVSVDFLIQMDASISVGFDFEYLEGSRYVFSVSIFAGDVDSGTVTLKEKTYELCFYTMGRMAMKAGIEMDFKIGLFSTKLANIGFDAGAGPYTKLYGYFYYELKYAQSKGRTQSYSGALLTEAGVYFDLALNAEAIGGKYSSSYQVLDKEWPLWTAGRRDNVLDFATAQEEMPEMVMRQYVRKVQVPDEVFKMDYLDLITGEGKTAVYNDWDNPERKNDFRNGENYVITMTNDKFSYDPKTNIVTVNASNTDVRIQGEMIITWKKQPMSFSSKPMQRRISLYWDNLRDGYMIVPYTNGGSYVPMIFEAYEKKVTAPADPTREGYIFAGWYSDEELTIPYEFPELMPNKDTNIYAAWEPATDTPYTVEHHLENYASGEYELKDVDNFKGTTDAKVTPAVKSYEGYNAPDAQGLTIAADGSAVLRYYYSIQRHEVTFNAAGIGREDVTYSLKYGTKITPPQMAAKGYTFLGWSAGGSTVTPEKVMGTEDLTYTAMWSKNPDTDYRVEYYIQQLDGSYKLQHIIKDKADTGAILSEEELRGLTIDGETADMKYTDGNGIVFNNLTIRGEEVESAEIAGDGKTVIKVNYKRALNNLVFDPAYDGAEPTIKSVYYQKPVDAPKDPVRTGYTFLGWSTDGETAVEPITVMGQEPITYVALWKANSYKISFHAGSSHANGQMSDMNLTYDADPKALTENAFVSADYDFAGWATKEGGSIVYEDMAEVKNLSTADGAVINLYAIWVPKTYEITYNNVELATHTNPAGYTVETETFSLLSAVRTGYDFGGWYNNPEFEGEAITEIKKGSSGNKQIYAKWIARTDIPYKVEHYVQQFEEDEYLLAETDQLVGTADSNVIAEVKNYPGFEAPAEVTVNVGVDGKTIVKYKYKRNKYTYTFDVNNGSFVNGEEATIEALYGEEITLPTPERNGYGFSGWFSGDEKVETTTMGPEDLTLVAKWKEGEYSYTVKHYTLNIGGDEDKTEDYTLAETETFTGLMDAEVEPEIKDYEGFTAPEEKIKLKIGTDLNLNVVEYYYIRNQYKLKWDFNGGSAGGQSYTEGDVYYGDRITMPNPEKKGYSYEWNEESYVTMPAKDLSYKAQWTANGYSVSFDANGGTVKSGNIETREVKFDSKYDKLADLEKAGYTFDGWFTDKTGGTEITEDTVLSTDENHTLYARFTPITYSITYVDELGGDNTNPATYTVEAGGITIEDAVKEGYTFLGWYEDGKKIVTIPSGSIGDREFTAQWREHKYTVVYHSNNGSDITFDQEFTYSVEDTLKNKTDAINKEYYEFIGWATEPNGEKVYDAGQSVSKLTGADEGVVNLYAAWKPIDYNINYMFIDSSSNDPVIKYLDGVSNSENPAKFNVNNNEFSMADAAKAGYTFGGWYLDAACMRPIGEPMTFDDYRDWTLYGKFTPNMYSIVYETHTGIGATKQTVIYDQDVTLKLMNEFLPEGRKGYTFLGWALSEGGEVVYTDGQVAKNVATSGEVTLHAVWELHVYDINYNLGKHASTTADSFPKSYSIETATDIVLPEPAAKSGFAFAGWYTDANYKNRITTINVKSDETDYNLYAKWEHAGKFSIKDNKNGTFTITRTIPDGAFVTSDTQTVYVRTLNGTAYGSTFSVSGTEDKYHFVHKSESLAFGPNDKEKTITVTENDGYLSAYVPASYQIGNKARNYYMEIYKVENTAGGLTGTIGTGRVKRTMDVATSYNVETLYNSWYSEKIIEGKSYDHQVNYETFNPDVDGTNTEIEKYAEALGIDDNWGIRFELTLTPAGSGLSPSGHAYGEFKKGMFGGMEYDFDISGVRGTTKISFPDNTVIFGSAEEIKYRGGSLMNGEWKPQLDNGTTFLANVEDYVRVLFETSSDRTRCTFDRVDMKYKIYDNTAPVIKYVAPIALTDYKKGDEVMLTVIYSEPLSSISGNKTLSLSSKLSTYFESPTYVDNGIGTNAVVFKVKAKKNLTADDAQKINEYLVFTESTVGGNFSTNIGTLSITVKDILGN